MAEKFSNVKKPYNLYNQEAKTLKKKMTTAKKTASRYIIVKMLKENILEALRKPLIIHKNKTEQNKKTTTKSQLLIKAMRPESSERTKSTLGKNLSASNIFQNLR